MGRIQLWSCGGGRQSAGIAAFIVQGKLPRPDHACMVALEFERRETFQYVNKYIRTAMTSLGIPFTFISRKKYATVDFWSGQDGQLPVLPVYTNKSGDAGKLSEFCSGEWKRNVAKRWAASQPEWKNKGVDNWIGISYDESHRRRANTTKWFQLKYPLLDMMPKVVPVAACLQAVQDIGWPPPVRSRCEHCPNQSDSEWLELTPEEFDRACRIDEMLRETDPNAFLHKQLISLRQVSFNPHDENDGLFGGCSAGMCF